MGVGASAAALTWIAYLGSVSSIIRGAPLGVPAALQLGLAAFSVALVIAGLAAVVGFAATSWRLGDTLFRIRWLSRFAASVPAPLIALLGATVIYVAWQIPYVGGPALFAALADAVGGDGTARLGQTAANAKAQDRSREGA